MNNTPSKDYIDYICTLYGESYDDSLEDTRPPVAGEESRISGNDWKPGQKAEHKSLVAFQKELEDQGIHISTSKIRKILITGGCWSTERSREIASLYNYYSSPSEDGGKGLSSDVAVKRIAEELGVSVVTVNVNLPYLNVVYNLDNKSSNAIRCQRYKNKKLCMPESTSEQLLDIQSKINKSVFSYRKEIKDNLSPEVLDSLSEIVDQLRKSIPAVLRSLSDEWNSFFKDAVKKLSGFLKGYLTKSPFISMMLNLSNAQVVVWKNIPEEILEKYRQIDDYDEVIQMLTVDLDEQLFLSVNDPIQELLKDNFFNSNPIFIQSLDAFERGDYCVAALGFTAVLDKYFSFCYKNSKEVRINTRANYLLNKIEEKELGSLSFKEYNDLILCCTYSESIHTFGEKSDFNKKEPKTLNRHWIMHGRYTRELTRFDCVRIIRMLYGTVLINEIGEET